MKILDDYLKSFKGDLYILCNFLLCKYDSRLFKVDRKGIIKAVSHVLGLELDKDEMSNDLDIEDVSEISKKVFL